MGKFLLGFVIAVILSGALFGAYMYGKGESKLDSEMYVPANTNQVTMPSDAYSPNITITKSAEGATMGTVAGKLCYPSEMIPPGKIEAKRTSDNMIFSQDYIGSQQGGGNTYSFPLEPGTYNIRFGPTLDGKVSTYGYHTSVCLTGLETTCGDTNPRQMVSATVMAGQSVVGFDLCDFYYQPQNAPVF